MRLGVYIWVFWWCFGGGLCNGDCLLWLFLLSILVFWGVMFSVCVGLTLEVDVCFLWVLVVLLGYVG